MSKRIWFLLGILTGFLLTEIWRRKRLEELKQAEAQLKAIHQSVDEGIEEFKSFQAKRSTKENIEYAMWHALDSEEYDDETEE